MDVCDGNPSRALLRIQRMNEDIAIVKETCQKDQNCPFTGLRLTENVLHFKYVGKLGIFLYTLTFSDDYPENSYLLCADQQDSLQVFNVPATDIFSQLARDLYQEMDFPDNPSSMASVRSTMETDGEEYSDYSEDDLDEAGEDYYENEDRVNGEPEGLIHPLLKQDMEMVRLLFGESAVGFRVFHSIDDMDVDLQLNMAFLDSEVAKAWRVNQMKPVSVRLHLSMSRYLDHAKPKIEVFQTSQKEHWGAINQIKKIVENFVHDHWNKLSNNAVLTQYTKDSKYVKLLNKEAANCSEATQNHFANDADLAHLMDMGFGSDVSRHALVIARGNVSEAANMLVSNPESCMSMVCDAKPFSGVRSLFSGVLKPVNPLGGKINEPKLQRPLSCINPKEVPSLEFGFLVQLFQYCRQRVRTLNDFCVICDEKHAFQSGSMLKPVVCSRDLCVFSFQTLGVMSDAADDIATQAEVVDLLIAIARSACKSSRKMMIFDPFPSVVNPGKPTELALNPKHKADHMARAEQALDKLLPMHEMIRFTQETLKTELDKRDVLCYPLLTWIISSNRCHIVKLPDFKCVESMGTPHQFLLLSSAPAKEEAFHEAKKNHKSIFAFHGSNIENWHSIMRHGLYNATGTQFQCHGSAYGSGIYLSPSSNMSFGYCNNRVILAPQLPVRHATMKRPVAEGRFMYGKELKCIALCEVIDSANLRKTQDIWVMPHADHVCTRFFFVYEAATQLPTSIDTRKPAFIAEINKALGISKD